MTQVAFIKTGDGNITLILENQNYSIGKSHPNYDRIVGALKTKNHSGLRALIDIPAEINKQMSVPTGGTVVVRNGQVFYRDMPMHNTVTERIMDFMRDGLPVEPLLRFLENLMANPMPMAVAELFDFLENTSNGRKQFPITEDGCFIGYKGVNNDFTDCHSGTFDNTPNITEPRPGLRMPDIDRKEVDPDRRHECSTGLHVGTIDYAQGFGQRTVLVKVNPSDCIAVPKDHNCSKLRVCKYKVIAEAPKESIVEPMYPMPATPTESQDESNLEAAYQEGAENYDPNEEPRNPYALDDPMNEAWQDGWDDAESDYSYGRQDEIEREETTTVTTGDKSVTKTVRTVKRPPCSYCGAKGGKKHAGNCRRPQKR